MAKSPEIHDPFNEEHHDEVERVYGKDKKHAFVHENQIPDPEPFDPMDRYREDKESLDSSLGGQFSSEERENADKKNIELLKQEIHIQQSEGVTSVYTKKPEEEKGHVGFRFSSDEPQKKEDEFESIEREVIPRISKRKNNDPITSMSAQQITRKSRDFDKVKIRSGHIDQFGNYDVVRENLKTMSDSKKQRSFRGFFRNLFKIKTSEGGGISNDYDPNETPEEVILNGKPMSQKMYKEEKDKAA